MTPVSENITFLAAFALPLLSFVLCMLISARFAWTSSLIASLLMFGAVVFCSILIIDIPAEEQIIQFNWFDIPGASFEIRLLLSWQSTTMLLVVALISFLIHLYSVGYMAVDTSQHRYFAVLGFFTFCMNGIILADDLLLLFVFWELVGFSSYLLIGYYSEKPEAGIASSKAFISNRIGDALFIIGLMIIWSTEGTFNISDLLSQGIMPDHTIATLCIFGGVVGKSAQLPLSSWLPDAMAGPTPVSALIHAATMVAAGIYLMVRITPILSSGTLYVVTAVGAATALAGAVTALRENDLKRILAYSTMSQLGLMLFAVGIGGADTAFAHLITHAFFKAGLFLAAGSVLQSIRQAGRLGGKTILAGDIRNMGHLRARLPVTSASFIICAGSLAGIPFTSGFLSKDAMLSAALADTALRWLYFSFILLIAGLTALYAVRVTWLVFFGPGRFASSNLIAESPPIMRVSMIALAIASMWFILSWNPINYNGWLINRQPSAIGAIASFLVVSGALYFGYRRLRKGKSEFTNLSIENVLGPLHGLTVGGSLKIAGITLRFDKSVLNKSIHAITYINVTFAHVLSWIDMNIIDRVVMMMVQIVSFFGGIFRKLQGGNIQLYVLWSILSIIIFLIWSFN